MSTDYSCTDSEFVRVSLPDLREGTLPLADIFWYCGGDRVPQTLLPKWQGCCAPVWLDGKTGILILPDNTLRATLPVGVPDHFTAMEAVGSGFTSILFPSVQINRNTAWINYIWYNNALLTTSSEC